MWNLNQFIYAQPLAYDADFMMEVTSSGIKVRNWGHFGQKVQMYHCLSAFHQQT